MTSEPIFRCWKCNHRLNVDPIDGEIRVVVHCRLCKAPNRIEQPAPRSFRERVEVKA